MSKFARFYPAVRGPWPLVLRLFATALLCFQRPARKSQNMDWMGTPNGQPRGLFEKYTTYPMLLSYQFSWLNLQLLGGPNPRFLF